MRAALTAIDGARSLSEILRRSVAFPGDVDSVATIACACASSSPAVHRDLPEALWTGLENEVYGRDYIADLDQRVLDAS